MQHILVLGHGADHDASQEGAQLVGEAELPTYPGTRQAIPDDAHLKELIRVVAPDVRDCGGHQAIREGCSAS